VTREGATLSDKKSNSVGSIEEKVQLKVTRDMLVRIKKFNWLSAVSTPACGLPFDYAKAVR
jgi:hypothetical protein